MDAKQAGLILMFGLAYIDGNLEAGGSEVGKIAEYGAMNFKSGAADVDAISGMMISASNDERLKYMLVAAAYIGANVDTISKIKMLDFLIELAKADGKVHDNELALIVKLKEAWL